MSNIYEKNWKAWAKICANYHAKRSILEKIEIEDTQVMPVADGLVFTEGEKVYKLFGKDPKKESELLTRGIDFKKDNLIIVIGIGNIELLELLMRKVTKDTKIVIYEPNAKVLKYVLWHYDISEFFEMQQAALLMDLDEEKRVDAEIMFYCSINWGIMAKNMNVITLPNYYLYRGKIHSFVKRWIDFMDTTIKSIGNSLGDAFNGFANNYKNIDSLINCNSIKEIDGKYKDYPAIIVASGPSLDKNIAKLKLAQDKALIIACDASLDACIRNEVRPDAIASIERDEPTYLYYYKGKQFDKDLVLLGPTVLWPEIYKEFPGKRIITSKNGEGTEGWWSSFFENVEFVGTGFSCANVALAVAIRAECNPIILIGQDLAFTEDKKHSQQTHVEMEGENDTAESDGNMVEDIYGNLVQTNMFYNLFRVWIETQITANPHITVIDATEGGAKIQGSKIMTLEEVIAEYCTRPIPKHMYEYLSDISFDEEFAKKKYQEILDSTEGIMEQLDKIQKDTKEHYELLYRLQQKDIGKMKEKQWIRIVKQMQRGNTIIQEIQKQNDIQNLYQPIIKQTVIAVKAIGNELNEETIRKNLGLQLNLMQMLWHSANLTREEYKKLTEYLKDKLNDEEKI